MSLFALMRTYNAMCINDSIHLYIKKKKKSHVYSLEISASVTGIGTDRRPPTPCSSGCGQKYQSVVHQGAQDQGYLPHPEYVQPGCHPEVSHR